MGAKDNLNKAMFDMFGLGKDVKNTENILQSGKADEEKLEPKDSALDKTDTVKAVSPSSYIAPTMEIEGCVKAKGDVEIAGILKGDVSSEGSVTVRSSVDGNISAKYLQLIDCTVNGDITVSEDISVTEGSTVNGGITAKSVSCSGKVNGDIAAEGSLALEATAYIVGNISAAALAVAKGAIIKGKLSM